MLDQDKTLTTWINDNSITVPSDFISQTMEYKKLLYEWNKVHNLTRVPESEFVVKHLIDSLMILKLFPELRQQKLALDAGTGAGLPGVVLAIALPETNWTLVDSLQKRVSFLEYVCNKLGLKNVSVRHARLEDLTKSAEYVNKFDIVTARALANLQEIVKLTWPLLNSSGQLLAIKGPDVEFELTEAQNNHPNKDFMASPYQLPEQNSVGHLIIAKNP